MASIKELPVPQMDLDFPLMKALESRRSVRRWADESLSDQEISNLLWAACGITKKETKRTKSKRTAPSACNSQSIKIYIALKEGLFLYDEKQYQLIQILSKDIRKYVGTQKMMHAAPAALIYVSDFSKMKTFLFRNDEQRGYISGIDCGFIGQNVYLYCTAAKLGSVFVALVKRDNLRQIMDLGESEHIICAQMVGKLLKA